MSEKIKNPSLILLTHYIFQLMPQDSMSYDRLLMYSKWEKIRYAINYSHEGFYMLQASKILFSLQKY